MENHKWKMTPPYSLDANLSAAYATLLRPGSGF